MLCRKRRGMRACTPRCTIHKPSSPWGHFLLCDYCCNIAFTLTTRLGALSGPSISVGAGEDGTRQSSGPHWLAW